MLRAFFPRCRNLSVRLFGLLVLGAALGGGLLACSDDDVELNAKSQVDAGPVRDGSTLDGSKTEVNGCKPSCSEGVCGGDDGCGHACGCPGGKRCADGVCAVDECGGVCADQEVCVAGQCICEPSCGGDRADDGCGGVCACPGGQVRQASGRCAAVSECKDTCESAGAACGEVCGQACGGCDDGSTCKRGACVCQPQCDGTRCDDGCGGLCECAAGTVCNGQSACVAPEACTDTCDSTARQCGQMCGSTCGGCDTGDSCLGGACVPARNCDDCSLAVYMLDSEVVDGRIKQARIAIDYAPAEGEPRPRMADFRVWADREVQLETLEAGLSMRRAKKRLYSDPVSGANFRKRADDSYQMLIYSAGSVERLQPGRVVTLTFKADTLGPIRFYLQRRLQVFAPASADAALQSSDYDHMVVVSR